MALCGLIAWLQNVHIITANGMYKSIQAEPWIADPARARLDPSNYLYFPLYGALCRLLDWLGIHRGVPWRQFAWLNAFFASLATVVVYAFVHRLTGSARAAALAACFHFGCGFVLLLSVISEDIMPGYTLVLGAMALAGLWFDRPTHRPRGAGRRAVHAGLADRMAAAVPDAARAGPGSCAGAAAAAQARGR